MRTAILCIAFSLLAIGPPREDAPRFKAKSIDGEKFSNESLKGQVVLLQFWATWCGVCRRDQRAVDGVVSEFSDRGLTVLAVSVNESRRTVERFLAQSPRSCKIILTEDTNLAAIYGARAFPMYVVIDRDGKIAARKLGGAGAEGLRDLLAKAGLR